VRQFIRVKVTFDVGLTVWLTEDLRVPGWWTCTENKKEAYQFKSKREVFQTLLKIGGQWLKRGRIVHVRAYQKAKRCV
jgi:hypothetical protein